MGTTRGVPRAVDPVHALRRPARRPVAAHRPAGDRGLAGRGRVPRVRHPGVRDLRADVPADVRPFRRALPEGPGRLRLPLPLHHHREDVRHAAGPAAGRDAVEPRRLRHRPELRADAAADARAPARRGPRVRRPHARRAPQGHPGLPEARRPPGSRRRLVPLPAGHARAHAGDRREVHRGDRARTARRGHPHRLRPARRGEGRRGRAVRLDRPPRRPVRLARALDERRGARERPARLRRRARQPPAQAGARLRAHRLPVRRALRLRRVPGPAAPPAAHARVAAPVADPRLRDASADRRRRPGRRVARRDGGLGGDVGDPRPRPPGRTWRRPRSRWPTGSGS